VESAKLALFVTRAEIKKWGREHAALFDPHYEDHPYEVKDETWHQIKRNEKCDLDEYPKSLFIQTNVYIVDQ